MQDPRRARRHRHRCGVWRSVRRSWSPGCWMPSSPPHADLELMVESRGAGPPRRTTPALPVSAADPRRLDTFVKADLTPGTVRHRRGQRPPRGLRRILDAVHRRRRHAGLRARHAARGDEARRDAARRLPRSQHAHAGRAAGPPLAAELARSVTRQKVQQYQRYFSDADRVLILTHHDPDPDALASGLALRTLLRRTRQTAIIGTHAGRGPPREPADAEAPGSALRHHHRRAARRVRQDRARRRAAALLRRAAAARRPGRSTTIPEQTGYTAVFGTSARDYGSTSTILTEHLRAVDIDISERTATAMLYAIKSDTLFFNRQANRADLDAFSYLYPLADAT